MPAPEILRMVQKRPFPPPTGGKIRTYGERENTCHVPLQPGPYFHIGNLLLIDEWHLANILRLEQMVNSIRRAGWPARTVSAIHQPLHQVPVPGAQRGAIEDVRREETVFIVERQGPDYRVPGGLVVRASRINDVRGGDAGVIDDEKATKCRRLAQWRGLRRRRAQGMMCCPCCLAPSTQGATREAPADLRTVGSYITGPGTKSSGAPAGISASCCVLAAKSAIICPVGAATHECR